MKQVGRGVAHRDQTERSRVTSCPWQEFVMTIRPFSAPATCWTEGNKDEGNKELQASAKEACVSVGLATL